MSDKHDTIVFRMSGRVEKVKPGEYGVDREGNLRYWRDGSCVEYHTVTLIDPANLVECEGGEEGAARRVAAFMLGSNPPYDLDDIRRAIRGTPPEPEPEEWMYAALREIYGLNNVEPDDEPLRKRARIIAKHYQESKKGE